jgi:hypothetical protein
MRTGIRGCNVVTFAQSIRKDSGMAQALVVVCDVCGLPAVETVSLKVAARSYQKDVCQTHLDEMIQGARAPRRGRPRTKAAPVLAGSAPAKRKTSAKRTTSAKRKTSAKRTARKRAS